MTGWQGLHGRCPQPIGRKRYHVLAIVLLIWSNKEGSNGCGYRRARCFERSRIKMRLCIAIAPAISRFGNVESSMPEQADEPSKPLHTTEPSKDQTPPPASAADVPPPQHWVSQDQLDAQENANRSSWDQWSTDVLLLVGFIVASIVTITVMLRFVWPLIRRHFHHRSTATLSHYWTR